jgi:hypothetical protein
MEPHSTNLKGQSYELRAIAGATHTPVTNLVLETGKKSKMTKRPGEPNNAFHPPSFKKDAILHEIKGKTEGMRHPPHYQLPSRRKTHNALFI